MTKPVAWMASNELLFSVVKDEIYHIPLYTQRELTDEEMLEVYKKLFNKKNKFKENLKRSSYFDFAKAILKKASEK
jgi:hypothetical protein